MNSLLYCIHNFLYFGKKLNSRVNTGLPYLIFVGMEQIIIFRYRFNVGHYTFFGIKVRSPVPHPTSYADVFPPLVRT